MRVTNQMMTNNVLYNINSNKKLMSKIENQYSSGKKIQRPSDDPIIAVRALKLRTNLSELNQYYEKNIPDALSWMEVTESALGVVNDILTQVHTYTTQGATDSLTEKDRLNIAQSLSEIRQQIYQEGNSNYAGRYVFTGYKTDTSLVFDKNTKDLNYTIKEKLSGKNIDVINKVINSYDMSQYDPGDPGYINTGDKPNSVTAYRLRLAYGNLKPEEEDGILEINFPVKNDDGEYELDADGNMTYDPFSGDIVHVKSTDPNAYLPEPGTVNYIADTGEIIMAEDVYLEMKDLSDIHITYEKDEFNKNDLRPEHYFDCSVTNKNDEDAEPLIYTKKNQQIQYEVNFNQKLTINTQGSDAITHDIGRTIDEMLAAVNGVILAEQKIADTKKMIADTNSTPDQVAALTELLEGLEAEKTLKSEAMQKTFGSSMTAVKKQQDVINVASGDIGSRYNRLKLTESRLMDQQIDFESLLSNNEDADLVDTVIRFKSQETIYNSALNAASKVIKNTLLDFL